MTHKVSINYNDYCNHYRYKMTMRRYRTEGVSGTPNQDPGNTIAVLWWWRHNVDDMMNWMESKFGPHMNRWSLMMFESPLGHNVNDHHVDIVFKFDEDATLFHLLTS